MAKEKDFLHKLKSPEITGLLTNCAVDLEVCFKLVFLPATSRLHPTPFVDFRDPGNPRWISPQFDSVALWNLGKTISSKYPPGWIRIHSDRGTTIRAVWVPCAVWIPEFGDHFKSRIFKSSSNHLPFQGTC